MVKNIDQINCDFYNNSGGSFSGIPFKSILPGLLLKYGTGHKCLEIGSGPGGLAVWLRGQGCVVTCIEPAERLAEEAKKKGLKVCPLTIQSFNTVERYDCIVAISSLIHVPKRELPAQIEKIAGLLAPKGIFFVSFIEGDNEGFEDPTGVGKERFFSKWTESELDQLLNAHFVSLEKLRIYSESMEYTFLLRVYALKSV
jgi:2-polyprenyl-3-methyl-5-hydroxy-6-metoxy-1,4-benzoquinol methylase